MISINFILFVRTCIVNQEQIPRLRLFLGVLQTGRRQDDDDDETRRGESESERVGWWWGRHREGLLGRPFFGGKRKKTNKQTGVVFFFFYLLFVSSEGCWRFLLAVKEVNRVLLKIDVFFFLLTFRE
jgi:hypothetical protein